ncbi:MAG: metalloregulator ArsR/SmtB family transcription factor [Furfurilactobacillus sp.]|jgi:DNA-binding transcriptional ArsR family regulator|uniref:Metalloregulator ArsR/SmtB family transcription factor n=1 Tax=Furfurilactobacillus milii TaxID=2888272 RepID=A0A6N9HZI2_9LACO|nr:MULTISPECIES: metalloregulator ArsR/SmtB family transcription factor [Furfurilactobacillus]QLE66045.1 Transcriptional regulator ArsR [Furfurilactobacillus rossiae]MCF6160856.1 metalloregulator ArsR/SmtB family transcription factor [Furfurilactobacillus milii]MCF6162950.1 metalloregulator ArsR/SmtB family transcription factor [Furfurilactobacillus milii]MCF6419659.1 metalloregulator ArsR/SmtB family transcription factor [Furfurilactobacillus milii]MCH4012563.1 metalloregulator ArsR/SmtB fami
MSETTLPQGQQKALDEFISNLDLLNTLADQNRQRLIILLGAHLNTGLTVTELTSHMSLSQPAVSHHLKILRQAGLVSTTHEGLNHRYHLTVNDALDQVGHLLNTIRNSNNSAQQTKE